MFSQPILIFNIEVKQQFTTIDLLTNKLISRYRPSKFSSSRIRLALECLFLLLRYKYVRVRQLYVPDKMYIIPESGHKV